MHAPARARRARSARDCIGSLVPHDGEVYQNGARKETEKDGTWGVSRYGGDPGAATGNLTHGTGRPGAGDAKGRWGRWLAVMLLVCLFPVSARAHSQEDIQSFSLTNFVGWLVDSDAANSSAGYDRDFLHVASSVRYTTTGTSFTNFEYQLSFRLLDHQSNPVPLRTGFLQTNTVVTTNHSITLPSLFIPGITSVVASYRAALKPAVRLDPYSTYRMEMRLSERPGGSTNDFTFTGDQALTPLFSVNHFTNMISGDPAVNTIATLNNASWSRLYAINTAPGKDTFQVAVSYALRRYDDFNAAATSNPVAVFFQYQLYDSATDDVIPLATNQTILVRNVPNYFNGAIKSPVTVSFNDALDLRPADGVQLDSVNKNYRAEVMITHLEALGQPLVPGNSLATSSQRLLHFNGDLLFGPILTRVTSIGNVPFVMTTFPEAVDTFLAVDNQGGYVAGSPTHTFGDGTTLPVRLRVDGTSVYQGGGTINVTAPSPDTGEANGIRFQRGQMQLNSGGGTATFAVWYPTGFGVRSNVDPANHLLSPLVGFFNQAMDQELLPANNPVSMVPAWGCEETKPFLFRFTSSMWDIPNGRFVLAPSGEIHYVRKEEIVALENAPVFQHFKRKPSNESHMAAVEQVLGSEVIVAADTQRHSARMVMQVQMAAGNALAHFPQGAEMTWSSATTVSINQDQMTVLTSQLTGAGPVSQAYARDCTSADCNGGVGEATQMFEAENGTLYFTPDGGLTAKGTMAQPEDLTWGWIGLPAVQRYAHRVQAFGQAGFHMPGFFLRGDVSHLGMTNRPGVLLYTGVGTNTSAQIDFSRLERPGSFSYLAGWSDYAGFNFRVGQDGDKEADSTLAATPTGYYPLTGRSKYYLRKSGVSGIHEAVFGSFPKTNMWYGYGFQVQNFGLAFRDSQNVDSRTEGSVNVRYPSDITQAFEKMIFNCLGGLESAQVPASEQGQYKELAYWQADIAPLSIRFDRLDGQQCDPGEGKLVMGVKAHAQPFEDVSLFGELGFKPDGNLITRDDGMLPPPFNSRLKLPSNLKFAGPAGEVWRFTPVNDAYLNNFDLRGSGNEPGWLNIAGKLDAPFYEDLKVHMHCSADKDGIDSPVHLMGGWGDPNRGYEWKPGKNFFNQNPSDQDNAGRPNGPGQPTVGAYRSGNVDTGQWLVRARRLWLDVVEFDYPLLWDRPARAFRSAKEVSNELLVLDVQHQVKYLSPLNADIAFGAQYTGLPQLNIANLAYDQLGGLKSAVDGVIGDVIDQGLERLEETLSAQARDLFEPAFDTVLRPHVLSLVQTMHTAYDQQPWNDLAQATATIASYATNGVNSLAGRIRSLGSYAGAGFDLVETLDDNLDLVEDALDKIDLVLTEESNGSRPFIQNLMQAIVGQAAPDFLGAFIPDKVNDILAQLDPTLDQLREVAITLRSAIGKARGLLEQGGEFRNQLVGTFNGHVNEINNLVAKTQKDMLDVLKPFQLGPADSPFDHYTDQQLTDLFMQKLEDRFFGSIVSSKIREVIKHRLYDLDAAIRQTTDSMFQQVNVAVRDIISEVAQDLSNEITPMLDDLNAVCGAGKVNGYAHINGDDLKELRIDAYAQLKVPTEMEFHGFLLIRELNSENFPTACLPAGGKATEVTLGADKIPVKFANANATLAAQAKFTFDSNTYLLLGMAGGVDLEGKITLGPATVKKLSASLAFGAEENYFSAAARMAVNSYEGFGGIFFGRTCTLDPFNWDPQVKKVLGEPPFTGAYGYVEVWIPVSEALLGIPATCMFQVSAGMGMGAGFFLEGPTFIGKAKLGVSGDFLCVASIYGDILLVGKKGKGGLHMLGSGTFEVEICAIICISASKTVEIEYRNGGWDIDF